jgi:hypothetical protein
MTAPRPGRDGHELTDVVRFAARTSHFKDNLPVRVAVDPYWRYYCTCGSVGGRRVTESAALLSFDTHVMEATS